MVRPESNVHEAGEPTMSAEMGGDHERRPTLEQLVQGRKRGADPRVVDDRAVLQRDVEVDTDEDATVLDLREAIEGPDVHGVL